MQEKTGYGRRAAGAGTQAEAEIRIRLQLEPFRLTRREAEITLLLLGELQRKDILESCGITNNTLKSHIRQIYRKLGAARRDDLAGRVKAAGSERCATSRSSSTSASL